MDIQLHFCQRGSGEPLILLHGNGEELGYFANQMEYFAQWYRVIGIDTRGHGQSPRGTAPFTLEQFARDLLAFMDAQQIARANILGFSDGGNIALYFALAHPERVLRLILNGANLDPFGVKLHVQLPIVVGYYAARLFAGRSPEAKARAEMLDLMVHQPHIRPEQLRTLQMPALVIAGTRDMIREKHTRLICNSLPNGQLVWILGDHFIANKQPGSFNEALLAFLRET